MKIYAQINEDKICIGVSQLSSEVIRGNMIEIPSSDDDYLWRKYENGNWSDEKFEPVPEPSDQPTTEEMINATYLETQYQTVLMEMQSGI